MKITEVSPQKNNPRRVNVYADGEYVFSLEDVDALVMGIKPGKELTEAELRNCLFESQFGKAKALAIDIISRKSMTVSMLDGELSARGYDPAVRAQVIAEMEEMGYVDDMNYALLFMEYAASKMWGGKKVRYELARKGVDSNIIEDALCSFELPGPREIAELILQKYGDENLEEYRTRRKVAAFFASRGFDYSVIEEALKIASRSGSTKD